MAKKRFKPTWASETFGEDNRYYFIDLLTASNETPYLQITRSDKVIGDDGKAHYRRQESTRF